MTSVTTERNRGTIKGTCLNECSLNQVVPKRN